MTTPTQTAAGPRREPSRPASRIVLSRRVVLSGALGAAAGVAFGSSMGSAGPSPAAGATVYSYGHSYTMMPSPYVSRQFFDEYQLDLGRRLASGPVISRGRSGTTLLDTISAIIAPVFAASTARKWRLGTRADKGIVLLENMMNDVSSQVGGGVDYLNAYEKALRLALGVFGAQSFLHADDGTRKGAGWTAQDSARLENGRTWHTKTFDDTISFVIAGGDSTHVSTLCTDAKALTQGTLQAECNGVILGSFGRSEDNGSHVCNRGASHKSSVGGALNQWTPAGWRVTGLNAAAGTSGPKTLVLRKVDERAEPVWVQGVYATSDAAPPVFVAKEPPRNPGAANKPAIDAFYANQGAYRALIDAVCDEYSQAVSVDLAPGWDNTTMVSALDTRTRFHPNTLGMSCIADNFERAINTYLETSRLGLR